MTHVTKPTAPGVNPGESFPPTKKPGSESLPASAITEWYLQYEAVVQPYLDKPYLDEKKAA